VSERHREEYHSILALAQKIAADPGISLALFHFNIPHRPYFSETPGPAAPTYDGGLELVDRTLGKMLQVLKESGLESRTALVLSSDHPLRYAQSAQPGSVPFLVHLLQESSGLEYENQFVRC
jgi:hypothetical protein